MNTTVNIIIDLMTLIFTSIGLITSILIFILIYSYRSKHIFNVSMYLNCNIYISMIITCCFLLDMYGHNLFGDIYQTISFNNIWCYIRSYLLHVSLSSFYHSFVLMAIYRYIRIVLYKHKRLQTFRFISKLIIFQRIIDFILIIPVLIQHSIEYISEYYFCEILISNHFAMLYIGSITYVIPIFCLVFIYSYIIDYMKKHKSQSIIQNRQRTIQRDFNVLRRIIILIGIMISLCFPSVILWIIFLITNYLDPISYQVGWPLLALALSILPIGFALLTPQLCLLLKTFHHKQNHHIQPLKTNIVR